MFSIIHFRQQNNTFKGSVNLDSLLDKIFDSRPNNIKNNNNNALHGCSVYCMSVLLVLCAVYCLSAVATRVSG